MVSEFPGMECAFGLDHRGQMVSIVGGGGKSSLLFLLAHSLTGRVITTTTTRIFAAQMKLAPAVCTYSSAALNTCLADGLEQFGHCLVVGAIVGEKAGGVPAELPGRWLARPDVDFVLVEADGSRMKPTKAPAAHEPVIPPETNLVIPVAGIDAVGGRLLDVAHRPELVTRLTGLGPNEPMTPAALALLLSHPKAGLKNVPQEARVIPLINKVETAAQLADARVTARKILAGEQINRVVIGAIQSEDPVREVHRRVTAVVLAAGESSRMNQVKQLLPWGDTTILGKVLQNLQASAVNDIVVVTGYKQQIMTKLADEAGVDTLHNLDYKVGEMLSSLQVAVGNLPVNREAVLVVLADQPMVEPKIIDRLLEAYWQGRGELVAPEYQGRRGNPVLIGRQYFPELLALPKGEAPRSLLRTYANDLKLVPVTSPAILFDLDTPGQYERWRPR